MFISIIARLTSFSTSLFVPNVHFPREKQINTYRNIEWEMMGKHNNIKKGTLVQLYVHILIYVFMEQRRKTS